MKPEPINTISILGCGWFGLAFAKSLVTQGYVVKGSTTTTEKLETLSSAQIDPYLINFTATQMTADPVFFETDVLFICIPPKRSSTELNDYPEKINAILNAAENKSKNIVLISSTSVYGDENKTVDENSSTNPDTASGKVVLKAEDLFKAQYPSNFTIIRFAGLIGPNRNPGRFFAGKTDVPNGLAPVNLVQQEDAVGFAIKLLEKQGFGKIYNVCSPEHPTRNDFYTAAAKNADLTAPSFISEKVQWKIINSVNVPQLGYVFQKELN
jgi:nucleoside-diphosphate-sugar epimerase